MYLPFFFFFVDIYVDFAPASSNLAPPSYVVHEAPENSQTYFALIMQFVIILRFFSTFCWLRRLANVHWPLLGETL
jgi:hypothetical protein